ncbi:MAG: AI-2E family transporter [Anaerolineales bacterium]|nr:AI-2E family transporter [Anaerolineales bacterium]
MSDNELINSEESGIPSHWSSTSKLVAGLSIIALVMIIVVQYNNLIAPLILAFVLSYLLHPVIVWLHKKVNISWRWSVNLIYILFIIIIAGLVTILGVTLVQQLQRLVDVISTFFDELPAIIEDLSTKVITIGPLGPFSHSWNIGDILSGTSLELTQILDQLIGVIQPLLGQTGSLLGEVASTAASTLGWMGFILIISYFILSDLGEQPQFFKELHKSRYSSDLTRIIREFSRIWGVFVRGQLVIILMVIVINSILLSIYGIRIALGIAFLVGLARLVPYIGPFVVGVVTAVVALFQGCPYFEMNPLLYAILAVVLVVLTDTLFDNLVTPRILGSSLGVHPAAVLVSALVLVRFIGIAGLLFAAPVLASLQMIGRYIFRMLLDLDPWPDPEPETEPLDFKGMTQSAKNFLISMFNKIKNLWKKMRKKNE